MTKLHELQQLGQSIWYDNIRRSLIKRGGLKALQIAGVRGVTSNPSIFEKAIAGSSDYDSAIARADAGDTTTQIYESLAIADIRAAADIFRTVYDSSNGSDGYVSIEVRPTLAHDTAGTIAEAQRLWATVARPNVMIKVPGTDAGIPAIEQLISEGINVNVTLLFDIAMYKRAAEAHIRGLETLLANGGDLSRVASVASFFISRIDKVVDAQLADKGNTALQGKIAIANAQAAYAHFKKVFNDMRWIKLASRGGQAQRLLWASTGTKNPAYPDTLYIDALIGQNTVNTVPPKTLNAFMDHGTIAPTLAADSDAADQLQQLSDLGIDLTAITAKLLDDGVSAFSRSYATLLNAVEEKRNRLRDQTHFMEADLHSHQAAVDAALLQLKEENVLGRIWQHDHTVWREDPTEISNRLGWLHMPEKMPGQVGRIYKLVYDITTSGFSHVLLLGMGGSSLAPEVFMETFGGEGLTLHVLDSTDADRVREYRQMLPLEKTLFIVATKSGGTAETLSFFKYFYNEMVAAVGETAGSHFVGITDPGSKLEKMAAAYSFRDLFINDPTIGGRYSVLSFFGLVPAGLVGVDLPRLLTRANEMATNAEAENCPVDGDNFSAQLGVTLGVLAQAGIDKMTIVPSPGLESFGDWAEQLVAESVGKDGKGILPVVGEKLGNPAVYGTDRVFVYMRLGDDTTHDRALNKLKKAGHPVISINLRDTYDLGQQFFLWEMATAIAGAQMGIQPFDQPNVEAAKIAARGTIEQFMETGSLPQGETSALSADTLTAFLAQAQPGDYVAIMAYVPPTAATDTALAAMQTRIRKMHKVATTVGYGPRFLHSTGQLHKGDAGNGLFIQLVSSTDDDIAIPDEAGKPEAAMTFDTLKNAQALGDAAALVGENRRLIRYDLGTDVASGFKKLQS